MSTFLDEHLIFFLWLAYWWGGFLVLTFAWWWDRNDVTLGKVLLFAFGTSFMGPFLLCLYLMARLAAGRTMREPKILIRGRGK